MTPRLRPYALLGMLLVVLVVLGFLAQGMLGHHGETTTVPVVSVAPVQRSSVPVVIKILGTVTALPNNDVRLTPAAPGKIQRILVHQGQWVHKGQILAELDARLLAAQSSQALAAVGSARSELTKAYRGSRPEEIAQAQNNVALNKANLMAAQTALNRAKNLYASKIGPLKDVEAAQAQYQSALAQYQSAVAQLRLSQKGPRTEDKAIAASQLQQAQASYQQSRIQLSSSRLISPISGRVEQISLSVGDFADTSTPVMRIINLSTAQVKAAAASGQIASIRPGQPVSVLLPGQKLMLIGRVQSVAEAFDATASGFPVYAVVPNLNDDLKAGMLVECNIQTAIHPNALLIPKTALIPDPEQANTYFVYVVAGQKLAKKPVTVGVEDGGRVEITAGLGDQDRVVVQGGYGLDEGSLVQVKNGP